MRTVWRTLVFAVAVSGTAVLSRPEGPPQKPAFEVVSVKAGSRFDRSLIQINGSRFLATALPLRAMIHQAYRVADYQIAGGPGWMDTDQWDIEAKAPEGLILPPISAEDPGRPSVTRLMLQSLIEDRFQFRFHIEKRELPVFDLTIAKGGPRLSRSVDQTPEKAAPPAAREGALARGGSRVTAGQIELNAAPFTTFVYLLSRQLDRDLVDKTGLSGLYDLKLRWSQQTVQRADAPPPEYPLLFTAIQEQLGLKLEAAKGPVEVLVIDSVQRPSVN